MGQILQGCATTTESIRRAVQHIQASLIELSRRYGINQKTVAKWKKRNLVGNLSTGPKEPKFTVLSIEDQPSSLPSQRPLAGNANLGQFGRIEKRFLEMLAFALSCPCPGTMRRNLVGIELVLADIGSSDTWRKRARASRMH